MTTHICFGRSSENEPPIRTVMTTREDIISQLSPVEATVEAPVEALVEVSVEAPVEVSVEAAE